MSFMVHCRQLRLLYLYVSSMIDGVFCGPSLLFEVIVSVSVLHVSSDQLCPLWYVVVV